MNNLPTRTAFGSWLRHRRVPVLLQLSAVECGAACLAMILNFHGRKTRVSECRESCGVGRDGLTAEVIARAGRRFGLRVKGYSLEPSQLRNVQLPAILHWNFNHFVVLESWSERKAVLVDPAMGRRRLSQKEFAECFTGVVLVLEPGAHFDSRQSSGRSPVRSFLWQLLRAPGASAILGQILGASLVLQLLGLFLPVVTKVIIDRVLPVRRTDVMLALGLGMAILALARTVTTYLRSALVIYLEARLDSQMMLSFFEHLLSLPFRFFQQRTSGDLMMRLASNSILREALTNQTICVLLDGAFLLVYLVILLVASPVFSLLVLAMALCQVVVLLATAKPMHQLVESDLARQSESQSYLVEALMGISTVKATGAEERVLDHWSNLFINQLNVSLKRSQLAAIIDTSMTAFHTIAPLALLWFGAWQVLHGQTSLGSMLALNTLAISFLTPLASLLSSGQRLQVIGAHLERIADVIEAEPEQQLAAVEPASQLTGAIELRNVDFRYDANSPDVLKNVSLAIEPGQKVALVGRTGSGKSTLAKLLVGLHEPTRGNILYDGKPLASLDYGSVRRQWGVVLQEPFLFSGSIRQNIALANPGMSLDEIEAAARAAAIHDEIERMPMGYETRIDEGGSGLSGGQRQRLSLARALAHKPALLLLDEATSHLDVRTESLVEQNLDRLCCTRIVVAHRLSTVRNADLILVLEEGEIVERGTHDELLFKRGHYAALVGDQPVAGDEDEGELTPLAVG
jgi:HlyB family type I secretion system ABC transporter